MQHNAFDAPTPTEFAELELSPAMLTAAVRAGLLITVGDGVFLRPEAQEIAVERLELLPPPFTTSQARTALQTSRWVALALLQWLDAAGVNVRLPDDRRRLRGAEVSPRD